MLQTTILLEPDELREIKLTVRKQKMSDKKRTGEKKVTDMRDLKSGAWNFW